MEIINKIEVDDLIKADYSDPEDLTNDYADIEDEGADPFSEYKHWGAKDTKTAGQSAPERASEKISPVVGASASKGRPFTHDEIAKLKQLASKHVNNLIIARNHYSDPKQNPKLHREGHLQLAHEDAFSNLHDAWKEFSNSDEYRNAPLPQKWKMQLDFQKNWHDQYPEHYAHAMDKIDAAHDSGGKADKARLQEEKRRLEHAAIGGGLGAMSQQEAAAHMGTKATDDEAPQVGTTQSAGTKFAQQNPEAIKQALASSRFTNVDTADDQEVDEISGKAPIKRHPDLDKPENKALINDFAGRYVHLMSKPYIDKIKRDMGVPHAQVDDAELATAADHAMWTALHQHNAAASDVSLHNFIKWRMKDAIKNNIKQQHTKETTAAAKRAAKQQTTQQTAAADPERTKGLKIYTPEEKAALQAKMLGQPAPTPVAPKPAPTPVAPTPVTPKQVPVPETAPAAPEQTPPAAPVAKTPITDDAKAKFKNITTIRRSGGK
jgi:hypothetical protein